MEHHVPKTLQPPHSYTGGRRTWVRTGFRTILDLDNTLLDGDNKRGIGHGESVHDMNGTVMSLHCNAALSEKKGGGGGGGGRKAQTH